MAETDDILAALAGRPISQLPRWERAEVRKEAVRALAERHATELRALEDDIAARRLNARANRLPL